MEGLHRCGAARGCAFDPPDVQFQQASTRLAVLSVSAEQSADLTILTDEGDTVMLSASRRAEADLLTYEHLSRSRQGCSRQSVQGLEFEAESEFTLAVQGDLNDQELADIQALLKDLGGMLAAFLTGADDGSGSRPEAAGEFDRFESLSAFQADFGFRVSMNYLNFETDQSMLRAASEPEPPAAAGPEETATAAPVSAPAPALPEAAAGPPAASLYGRADEAGHAARRMAERVHAWGGHGHRRMRHLAKLLKNALAEMLSSQAFDAEQTRRGQSVIEKFMDEFKSSGAAVEVRAGRTEFNLQMVGRAYETAVRGSTEPALVESA